MRCADPEAIVDISSWAWHSSGDFIGIKEKPGTSVRWSRLGWPRQESNLDLELRKLLYYPLYYEALIFESGKDKQFEKTTDYCFSFSCVLNFFLGFVLRAERPLQKHDWGLKDCQTTNENCTTLIINIYIVWARTTNVRLTRYVIKSKLKSAKNRNSRN